VQVHDIKKYGGPKHIIAALSTPHPPTIHKYFILTRIPSLSSLNFDSTQFDSQRAKSDPTYLYNRNVDKFPREWIRQQKDYTFSLSWRNKIRLLCYTHGGDVMINSFILGTFNSDTIVRDVNSYTYNNKIFPLALDMYLHTRRFSTLDEWLAYGVCKDTGVLDVALLETFFDQVHNDTFENVYYHLLGFLTQFGKHISDKMWYTWTAEYLLHLNHIFNDAPPAPPQGFYTYRGVKNTDFVKANSKNIFVNETFMSTSMDLTAALRFKSTGPCCLFSIQVLPGSKCLLPACLSYYNTEMEILFPPGRQLFITKRQFMASNAPVLVTRFSLMN
jgi:hypothetical protein